MQQIQLPNGLWKIDEGIVGEEDTGDTLHDLVYKLNKNFEILLTEEDNLAGEGLTQSGRKLNLDQNLSEFIQINVEDQQDLDLSTVVEGSTIYLIKQDDVPDLTFNFLNLSDISIGTEYKLFFNLTSGSLLTHFQGIQFIPPQTNNGELLITSQSSFIIQKLETELWGLIRG